jgi:ribose transport system substrate-binding protein
MKKVCALALIVVFAAGGLCYAGEKVYRFGMALQTLQNPFYISLNEGAQKAAAQHGDVKLVVTGSEHSTDLFTQVRQVEDFIAMKLDVVGIVAIERKGIIPTLDKCYEAGIPVIMIDTDSEGGKRECFIAADEELAGTLGAEWIAKAFFKQKAKVGILEGAPGSLTNHLRCKGFNTVMKNHPKIQIVSSLTAKWRRDLGMRVMDDMITAHPDLDAVMAMNDEMALGAVEALRARGKLKQVKIVGINGAEEAIQQVYRGNMAADIVHYPERIGELFVYWARKIAEGEKPPADLPKTPTDPAVPHIDSGVGVVDTHMLQIKVAPALKKIEGEIKQFKDL